MATFAELIKQKLVEKFVDTSIIATESHKDSHRHVCLDLADNYIDGKIQTKCSVKGDIAAGDIKYHVHARSLNSSQVMCISYFKKFFEKNEDEHTLLQIFRNNGVAIPETAEIKNAVFEYEPDPVEKTNYDFFLELNDGIRIFIEVKYTEEEFAKKTEKEQSDEKYINKWADVYAEKVENNYILSGMSSKAFFDEYQINRNILRAEKKDFVLFISPKAHDGKKMQADRAYIDKINSEYKNIMNIYWEDLMSATLELTSDEAALRKYYEKFADKYISVLKK